MKKQKYDLEKLPFYSKKVSMKIIKNGWLIHYDEQHWDKGQEKDVICELEKAFTYDFDDEIVGAWKELVKFVASKITGRGIWIDLYPEENPEEKKKDKGGK